MEKLRTTELDEFSELLFLALDCLGGKLLPTSLKERPSAFEKYPRMLIALIQRHGVNAGFEEWQTKVLRDASDYHKENQFPKMERLRAWMLEHDDLFDKTHLAHLKRSIYGRVYAYLYPRRLLVVAYANAHKGQDGAFESSFIKEHFREAVAADIENLRDIYEGQKLNAILIEAEQYLIFNKAYYQAWK